MNYFGQVLQNNYLKTNFENSEMDFVPKICLFFLTFKAHISRAVNAKELSEAILKS